MKKGIQLVALLLTVVMSSCTGGKDKAAVKQEDEKPRVKVADVTARPVDQIQDYTATVEAEVKNNIAPSSPVRIDQIFVEVGDRVSKGQKLVQMDAANLKQTKLQLDNLRKRLYMARSMQIYGVISLLLCVVCTFFIYIGLQTLAVYTFGVALLLLVISLGISVKEILISVKALEFRLDNVTPEEEKK